LGLICTRECTCRNSIPQREEERVSKVRGMDVAGDSWGVVANADIQAGEILTVFGGTTYVLGSTPEGAKKPMNACVHTYTKSQTPSTRRRGPGWRIHGSVEDTRLSSNKQLSLSVEELPLSPYQSFFLQRRQYNSVSKRSCACSHIRPCTCGYPPPHMRQCDPTGRCTHRLSVTYSCKNS
jgi:hypothetical protein